MKRGNGVRACRPSLDEDLAAAGWAVREITEGVNALCIRIERHAQDPVEPHLDQFEFCGADLAAVEAKIRAHLASY